MAGGQINHAVAAAFGIEDALQAGRGADQHTGGLGEAGAHHRHVAGVIDHALLLLEGGFMLLIDDDQPQIGKGQEQRAAGADQHWRSTLGHSAPGVAPGGWGQFTVPQRRRRAETCGKALQPLGGEGDFGQQHQCLPAGSEAFGDGVVINLGLARTGDAAQQGDAEAARGHCRPQALGRCCLVRAQAGAGMAGVGRGEAGRARQQSGDKHAAIGHAAQQGG